jgi:hypothetical protein
MWRITHDSPLITVDELERKVDAMLFVDIREAKHQLFVGALRDLKRADKGRIVGQMVLFDGEEAIPFYPDQVLEDKAGRLIVARLATIDFVKAELDREEKNAQLVNAKLRNDRRIYEVFERWVKRMLAKGERATSLTLERCLRETHTLRDVEAVA